MKNLSFGLILAIYAANMPARAASDIQANPSGSLYLQDARGTIVRSAQGLCWRLGHWTPADAIPGCDGDLVPPITKATAPPIVPPTVPIPEAVAAPPQPCDFSTTFSSDEAFAFNRATLSSTARKRIDEEVLPRLEACAEVNAISVTGHADRLGSQQYNLRLSAKRAQAVADYLAAKGVNITMDITGAGIAQPIKQCSTKISRTQLIECLTPNRRVTIEVRGTAKRQ